jgi:aspartyl-tRNA(Asn)/glutamyl-tRNA(Gln) amidotransferase subunit C
MMVKITEDLVEKIADSSQLKLEGEEKTKLALHLTNIFAFARRLQEVDTTAVEPTVSVSNLINVWREDKVLEWLSQEQALAQAKDVHEGCFRVPRIMEEE